MSGELIVVPYDPAWPTRFESIEAVLQRALVGVPVLAIEHVGSTSVTGLAAKPIIDIDIVVHRDIVPAAIAALEAIGYRHIGDLGVPDREALRAPMGAPRQNTYVTVEGCLSLRNHLGVRDVLRARPDLRDEYGAVKLALANHTDDIDVYIDGKTDVVLKILSEVGFPAHEMSELERINRL